MFPKVNRIRPTSMCLKSWIPIGLMILKKLLQLGHMNFNKDDLNTPKESASLIYLPSLFLSFIIDEKSKNLKM